MTFPNALEGVKKIYKAEILDLIATILMLVSGLAILLGLISKSSAGLISVLGGSVVILVAAVISLIALIRCILGVKKAIPDEQNFQFAFYALIGGIIASVIIGIFSSNATISDIGESINSACSFLTQYYIVTALIALAQRLNDGEMQAKATSVRKALMCVWIINIVLKVAGIFTQKSEALAIVSAVIGLVAIVFAIVAYVMYLKLLKNSAVMLEK